MIVYIYISVLFSWYEENLFSTTKLLPRRSLSVLEAAEEIKIDAAHNTSERKIEIDVSRNEEKIFFSLRPVPREFFFFNRSTR